MRLAWRAQNDRDMNAWEAARAGALRTWCGSWNVTGMLALVAAVDSAGVLDRELCTTRRPERVV
jgi:hypothetical protein